MCIMHLGDAHPKYLCRGQKRPSGVCQSLPFSGFTEFELGLQLASPRNPIVSGARPHVYVERDKVPTDQEYGLGLDTGTEGSEEEEG